jgi:thioredoxin reductase
MRAGAAEVEVIVVGGGPAGLSAALVLGRCRREVVLFDGGRYRNERARRLHGFLTRDGIPPAELRRIARLELARYPSVRVRGETVAVACREADGFVVQTAAGDELRGAALLLATGLVDDLPAVPGVDALYGERVFHCPYCDGWEHRDEPLGLYGRGDGRGGTYALTMARWSNDLVLFTDGPSGLHAPMRAILRARGIDVDERRLRALERDGDGVRLVLEGGDSRWRRALFFDLPARPASDLATQLGAELDDHGGVRVDRHTATGVPGLYVAGDASREALQAVVAAGEGCAAALAIDTYLGARQREQWLREVEAAPTAAPDEAAQGLHE